MVGTDLQGTLAEIRSKARKFKDLPGGRFRACCPAHDDRDPSLDGAVKDGKILLICRAQHCAVDKICAAWGIKVSALFEASRNGFRPRGPDDGWRDEIEADRNRSEPPFSVSGDLQDALNWAAKNDRIAISKLAAYAAGEEWQRMDRVERAMVLEWVRLAIPQTWKPAVAAALGTVDARTWRYRPPPPEPEPIPDELPSLADIDPAELEPPDVVAWGLAFNGRLGLLHGPPGGGKTTLFANVASRLTTGADFAGQPCPKSQVLIMTEDEFTWAHAIRETGGDLSRVRTTRWWPIPAKHVLDDMSLIVIDTMAYAAALGESDSDFNQDRDVDIVLRPLSKMAREHAVAVVVLDHEPHNPNSATGDTLPRPRGSGAKSATPDYTARIFLDEGRTVVRRGKKVRVGIEIPDEIRYTAHGEVIGEPPDKPVDPCRNDWIAEHLNDRPASVTTLLERAGKSKSKAVIRRARAALEALVDEDGAVVRELRFPNADPSRTNGWLYRIKYLG